MPGSKIRTDLDSAGSTTKSVKFEHSNFRVVPPKFCNSWVAKYAPDFCAFLAGQSFKRALPHDSSRVNTPSKGAGYHIPDVFDLDEQV